MSNDVTIQSTTEAGEKAWSIRDRVVATLKGEPPDRLPFIDRLEIWYRTHQGAGTVPEQFTGMSLGEVHRAIGMGQEKFVPAYRIRLRGVEMISTFEGKISHRETDPVLNHFPHVVDLVSADSPGVTVTEFLTPVGKVSVEHETRAPMIAAGMEPYMSGHLIKEASDYRTVEYILERAESILNRERFQEEETRLGEGGFTVPLLQRIPFQHALLEYLGEIPLFEALYDHPKSLGRLLALLDRQLVEILHSLDDSPFFYVEFGDNLHAEMTNPRLFSEFCLPYYQCYTDILHGQGKKVGSHTDGELKPLLGLLAESGLDVCESFSPAPLTECTLEEAWIAWQNGPVIWGGIPSPILEERTPFETFETYVERLLETVAGGQFILGVGDMVMGNNLLDRVRYIAQSIETCDWP